MDDDIISVPGHSRSLILAGIQHLILGHSVSELVDT